MKEITLLFVEDDPCLGSIIRDLLEAEDYTVWFFNNAETALAQFRKQEPDLCVLDVMLPGMDGFELGRIIRTLNKEIPILFLTAKTQKEDVIEGFQLGADDYLKKPFSMEELVLRLKVLLRRKHIYHNLNSQQELYEFGRYNFYYSQKILVYDGISHLLTHRETEILKLLLENRNHLVARSLILKHIWNDDSYFNTRSMDVFIAKLRKHFKNDQSVNIVNVRGSGFKLLIL